MAKIPKTIQDKLLQKIAEQKGRQQNTADIRTVQLWPDRDEKDQSLLLSGTEHEIMTQATLIMAIEELLKNRDVGVIIGEPLIQAVEHRPNLGLELYIDLRGNYESPFYNYNSKKYQDKVRRSFSIPFAKTVTFQEIKSVFDLSENGYPYQMWGHWSARAWLSDKSEKSLSGLPQVVACGDSEARALSNLKKILSLSKGKKLHEVTSKNQNPSPGQKQYKVFPYSMTVAHRKLSSASKGRKTKSGNIASKQGMFWLYPKEAPLGWDKKMRELSQGA